MGGGTSGTTSSISARASGRRRPTRKDRSKDKPWIGQFAGLSLDGVGPEKWSVGKDGGAFAYRVGATISARAVTNATRRALEFAGTHRDALFAAQAGATL